MRFIKVTVGCAFALTVLATGYSMRLAHAADEPTPEEELHVHRLKSGETSPYDAFAYLNRVAAQPAEGQSTVDYAGNIIFSRLSNIEGRIQLKVVDGFQREEYLGYKTFMRAWPEYEGISVGNCVVCHTPSSFTNEQSYVVDLSGEAKPTPTLRNLEMSAKALTKVLEKKREMAAKAKAGEGDIHEAYKLIDLNDEDVKNLVAFLQSLKELEGEEFRQIIVDATILDTSDML